MVTPNEIYIHIHLTEKDTPDRVSIEEQEIRLAAVFTALGIDVEKRPVGHRHRKQLSASLFKNKNILKVKVYSLKVGDAVTATKVFSSLEEAGISNAAVERLDHSAIDAIKNT